ncbi:hypothetical protein LLG96_05790 [bacterium]|nr:hypothetical protein [bacterium]
MKRIYFCTVFALVVGATVLKAPSNGLSATDETVNEAKKHYSFAVQQKNAGNSEEARRQFEKSIALWDSLYQVHYAYGDLLDQMGDKDGAVKAFRHALELKQDYYNAAARLATLYTEKGDYASTLEMYILMHKLKPDNPRLLATISSIREYLGDSDGAYADLATLIESGEDSYDNLMKASEFAFGKGDYEKARMYAVLAMGKRKDDHRALEISGKASMLLEDRESAARYYRRLAETDSTSVEVIVVIEDIYRALSDRANLVWALKRHNGLEPDNVAVLGELCEYFNPDELTEEGITYVKKGMALAPEDGRFHILLGVNYKTLGQTDKALDEFRKAMKDDRWSANAQRLIWQIERPESDEEKAERTFFKRGKE